MTLADILRLRADAQGPRSTPRSVIMVCLAGGPSHLDMYDLKPEAPSDYRGEFQPIQSNVPGFDVCEHMQVGGKSIWHSLKSVLPVLDRSIHALVTELSERGLDKEVLVLVWGEFGRTPRISLSGRDHWPDASFALFAGAVPGGQVVGQTDSRGERPTSRALSAQNVIGTVYHALGIDYRQKLIDFSGRPMQLLDDGQPISELTG